MKNGESGLLHASTGSGKTYAVWFAALNRFAKANTFTADNKPRKRKPPAEPLSVLWITPMRALAADTARALEAPLAELDIPWSVGLRTGDTSGSERARQSRRLPSALITTPESLTLLLTRADAQVALSTLKMVVVDEWHELIGNKRGVQLQLALARLRRWNPQLIVWGISATLGNQQHAQQVLIGDGGVTVQGKIVKDLQVDTLLPPSIERFPWAGHMGLRMLPQVVAEVFQVDIERIQITATNTDKVPNTSPTAASSGTDLNGKAAQNAAEILKQRLVEFAARHHQVSEAEVEFRNGHVRIGELYLPFAELAQLAWMGQVSLSSTGYYKTPKIFYDRSQARGRPFYYYAFGAACVEVIVDTLTGEYKMLRTDILHDVGASLNPAIDIGQVEGGYIQGAGWLTTEELVWNDKGKLMTSGPASYKIPAVADMPLDLRIKLVENRKNPEDTVFHSKAVGEPPFMLGIAAWCAIKDAVASLGDYRHQPNIDAPATPEKVLWGCEQMRQHGAARRASSERAEPTVSAASRANEEAPGSSSPIQDAPVGASLLAKAPGLDHSVLEQK